MLALPAIGGGCGATLTLGTLATAAGLAATAVGTGADVFGLGKLNSAEAASADAVRLAVEHVADDLGFEVVGGGFEGDTDKYLFRWRDDKGAEVKVIVEPRTATLTRLRIDVGLLGNEPTARLILARIRRQLDLDGSPPDPPSSPDATPLVPVPTTAPATPSNTQ